MKIHSYSRYATRQGFKWVSPDVMADGRPEESGKRINPDPGHDRGWEIEIADQLTKRRQRLFFKEPFRRNARYAHNRYSQREVAKRMGITAPALCYYEQGIQFPKTFAGFQRWAQALGGKLSVALDLPEVK